MNNNTHKVLPRLVDINKRAKKIFWLDILCGTLFLISTIIRATDNDYLNFLYFSGNGGLVLLDVTAFIVWIVMVVYWIQNIKYSYRVRALHNDGALLVVFSVFTLLFAGMLVSKGAINRLVRENASNAVKKNDIWQNPKMRSGLSPDNVDNMKNIE